MAVLPTISNLRGLLQKVIFVPIVYGFISLLPMFLTGWENSDRLADRLFSTFRSKQNTFDFIVVGGGTAGALIANRLSEHYRVLLLEAGGTPMPFQTIPALALKFLNHPQTDWSHKTVPQRKACLNSINQQSSWSTGRGLGGTTNINFMTHVRGHPLDFEKWAEITGDSSWGYASVLPYFKRYETFSGTSNDPEARGHNGELRIRKPNYVGLSEDWIRAGQELGYPFVDLNGRHEEGFGILQYPIYKGIRQSSYAAFLLPMHKSPRLTIRRYALVRKVLFRDMNNKVSGVEYVRHGSIETAIATKEVILSAGTLGSSKLLMLSGVGPKAHLDELGIPVRSDLPVGRNLQDHLGVHLGPFFVKEPKSFLFDRDVTPENIVRWLFLGTGPITTTGYQGAASIASSVAKTRGEGNWPDLHLILHGQAIHQGYTDAFAYAYSLQEDELMQYYQNAIGQDSFHIYVVGARPSSTGQVLLSGTSIGDPLVINPRYLEDGGNGDFKILLEGVKTAMSIANTSMFKRLGTEFTKTKLPGCQDFDLGTDEYWECYIRRFTLTMHNPVGTAAMGAVVDPTLKVHGIRGLRVVDASVQPTVVSVGTAASTFMIAEKGVDYILKDYGIPDRDQDWFDVLFGKNGFFKKNPVLRILQREFDTLNPLRALFKPFTARRNEDDGEWGDDVKERFTRDGGIDNPLLQVISTVFGNANLDPNQRAELKVNNKVTGTSTISSTFYESSSPPPTTTSTFQKRSNENYFQLEDSSVGNVLSKNQWVLESSSSPAKASNSAPSQVISIAEKAKIALNITELSGISKRAKGKGGKRYQLLQQILKMEAENKPYNLAKITANTPPSLKSTTPITTGLPTTPSSTITTTATSPTPSKTTLVNTPVGDGPLIKQANVAENELFVNTTSTIQQPPLVAKPISVVPPSTPSLFGLFPPLNQPSGLSSSPTENPLSELLKSINSFGSLVNSLTAKDNIKPLLPPIPSPSAFPSSTEQETFFKVSPSQNLFHGGGNNGNIFSFLTNFNNNNYTTGTGSGTTVQPFPIITNNNNNNPFQFLFGQPAPATVPVTVPTPTTIAVTTTTTSTTSASKSPLQDVSSAVGVAGGNSVEIVNDNLLPKTQNFKPSQQNGLFSNWFKPLFSPPPKGQSASTSPWFKPLDNKPILAQGGLQQSSSSWFHPFTTSNSKSTSGSDGGSLSSWFKPLNFTTSNKSSTSSWFKPFNFNSQQSQPIIGSSANSLFTLPPTLTSPAPPTTDPFGTLFELFFGGLKKQERRAVFKTLNSMLEAGETIADLLGASGGGAGGSGSLSSLMSSIDSGASGRANLDFLTQVTKGKRTVNDSDKNNINNYDELLKSLIAMNQVIDSFHSSKKLKTPAINISDNSLEDFLSTFNYPSPSSLPSSPQKEDETLQPPSNKDSNSTSTITPPSNSTIITTTEEAITTSTDENSETTTTLTIASTEDEDEKPT